MKQLVSSIALALVMVSTAACGGSKKSLPASTTVPPSSAGEAAEARDEGMIPDDKAPLGSDGTEPPGDGLRSDPCAGGE